MFDIGFSEIAVIGVVALIVIGPERLPKVARTLGHLVGRAQRYVNTVKADISREMNLEELTKFQSQIQQTAQDLHQSVHQAAQDAHAEVQELSQQVAGTKITSPSAALPAEVPVSTEVVSHQLRDEAEIEAAYAAALRVAPVAPPEVSPQMELALPPAPLMYEKKF